ncbi:hypothetical protein IQ07DRAFT_527612 [Pyrenochaeta sp. DS3sAY3a]|nr:hypothetical protein IQ07DRAFT_527612 [Pyrenochaeta sp. DS3sAY3a]
MSSILARSAFRAAPRLQPAPALRRWASASASQDAERQAGKQALKTGAKRDPELYVLLAIMSGVFGLAGWHFSRSPTSASSEANVAKAADSEPWKMGSASPYQYHPGGDTSVKKDAPSALNVVVIPNVTLPKELHDTYNKWGKDGY